MKYELIYTHPEHGLIDGGKWNSFLQAHNVGHEALRGFYHEFKSVPFIITRDEGVAGKVTLGSYDVGSFIRNGVCVGRIMPVEE